MQNYWKIFASRGPINNASTVVKKYYFLTKGTTYVAITLGTFICSRCAGLLRDLNFKVKGIGVCNFSDSEMNLLSKMGNDVSSK